MAGKVGNRFPQSREVVLEEPKRPITGMTQKRTHRARVMVMVEGEFLSLGRIATNRAPIALRLQHRLNGWPRHPIRLGPLTMLRPTALILFVKLRLVGDVIGVARRLKGWRESIALAAEFIGVMPLFGMTFRDFLDPGGAPAAM